MDRQAFKNRMQQLKQYREQNPGKTYLDWKNSLPNNLQDDSDYNLHRAYELGYTPEWNETDKSYHLPTRDSETGEILKKPWHPTFIIGLQEDAKLGYYPQTINGTTYTTTWEGNENPIYKYANGGELEASLPEITVTAKRVRPRIPGDITSQVQPLDIPTQLQSNTVDNNTYSGNNLDEVNVVASRVNKQAPNGIIANMIRTDIPRVNKLRPFNSLEQPSIVDNDLVITDQPDRLGDETITTELLFINNDLEITDTPDKLGSETILGNYGKRRHNSRYTSNFQNERDWLANFATERSKLPEFADQLDTDQLTAYLDRIYNTPVLVQDAEVYSGPANSSGVTVFNTDKDIDYAGSDFYDTGASIKVMNDPTVIGNIIEYSKDLPSNVLHELEHSGQISTRPSMYHKEGFSKRVQKAADILGYDLNTPSSEYTNNPWEVLARRQQMFKEINADPTKKYTKKDLKSIRSYLKKYDLNHLGDDKILQLLNNVASIDNRKGDFDIPMAAEGGEIPPTNRPVIPEEPQPYKGKLYKDRYGRKYTEDQLADYYDSSTDEIDRFTGKPFIRGLKPVGDLEDAANVTPVGDAISAYGVYNAIKNSDWEGAGLAALGMVPFMPMTVKQFRKKYKGISPKKKSTSQNSFNTTVNKNYVQDRINEAKAVDAKNNAKLSKVANQTYNVAERLMDDPEYLIRANQVKKQFGDDYTTVYADIIDAYNNDPFSLPNISSFNGGTSKAQLQWLGNGKYSYRIDPNTNLNLPVTEHELSHYADYKRNMDRPDPHGDSNMFYQMSKDLNGKKIDNWDWYYSKPTEQKAHMNQLREYMFRNGMISTRGEKIDAKTMKKVLDQMSKTDSMKEVARASKQFGSINKYTKWFNSIPLLGVGAAAMYNNRKNESN